MKFLWFAKKKVAAQSIATHEKVEKVEMVAEPREIYSLVGYICDTNPLIGSKNTELTLDSINSMIFTALSKSNSAADIAAKDFFEKEGAILLPISDYEFSADRGVSARVTESGAQRTILIGSPIAIARVSAPFSEKISAAVKDNGDGLLVAIDGIAYASYTISKDPR